MFVSMVRMLRTPNFLQFFRLYFRPRHATFHFFDKLLWIEYCAENEFMASCFNSQFLPWSQLEFLPQFKRNDNSTSFVYHSFPLHFPSHIQSRTHSNRHFGASHQMVATLQRTEHSD